MKAPPIGVLGGGLAGLAAAISLAKAGREVIVWESADFGRDKVCGEFLSPEAEEDLDALGSSFAPSEVAELRTIAFMGASPNARIDFTLKGRAASGVTRRALETRLAERARAAGATLLERSPVHALEATTEGLWVTKKSPSALDKRFVSSVICAFGKRSTLDEQLSLPRASPHCRADIGFLGLKAYFPASSARLSADVELYVLPGGYVGVNPVDDGRIGVCALLKARPNQSATWPALLELAKTHPGLARRLDDLGAPLSKPRGLARFGFGPQSVTSALSGSRAPLLFAGDAARLIPSFTGDGMAVALRSGRLAASASLGKNPAWAYRRAFASTFAARFAVSRALHGLLLGPPFFETLAPLIARSPRLVDALYRLTRR